MRFYCVYCLILNNQSVTFICFYTLVIEPVIVMVVMPSPLSSAAGTLMFLIVLLFGNVSLLFDGSIV